MLSAFPEQDRASGSSSRHRSRGSPTRHTHDHRFYLNSSFFRAAIYFSARALASSFEVPGNLGFAVSSLALSPGKVRCFISFYLFVSITQREVLHLLCFRCSTHLFDHLFLGYRYSTLHTGDLNSSDSSFTDRPGPGAITSLQPTHRLCCAVCQQVAGCPPFSFHNRF